MKVLLRKYQDKYYVWVNARWESNKYIAVDGSDEFFDEEINQTNILAIKDDERAGYVVCNNCGKLVKNDQESIEAHYAEEEAKKDCLRCGNLATPSTKKIIDAIWAKNEDGTYRVTQTFESELFCSAGYWRKNIDSEDAKRDCVYNMCRRRGMATINDTFIRYPGLFEKFITVDVLIANKYSKEEYRRGFFEYDLKCRGTLKACVNELGIIDHFILYYRGYAFDLYYSDKYKRIFVRDGGRYDERTPYGVSQTKMEQVKTKIESLYKEAKNEQA